MQLVTIIGESLAREPILKLLREVGAHGWTFFEVSGSGRQGERTGEIPEYSNIQVEVIVPPAVAENLLNRLQHDFFPRFAMVAYLCEIRVLRAHKF